MKTRLIYITTRSKDEACAIGRYLVTARLAACANVFDGITSIYMWEDRLQDERESVLIAKTTEDKVPAVIEAVKARHSYDCPCIVSLPVDGGNSAFLDWVAAQVK